jgi:hypothetical protein
MVLLIGSVTGQSLDCCEGSCVGKGSVWGFMRFRVFVSEINGSLCRLSWYQSYMSLSVIILIHFER